MANGFFPEQGAGLQGLLANPAFNLGLGLLSEAGPSRQPRNIGRGLLRGAESARAAQMAQMKNQALREELRRRAQQREAQQRLSGLFQTGMDVDVGALPTAGDIAMGAGPEAVDAAVTQVPMQGLLEAGGLQSPEVMGLLFQAAPEQFTQGLLGQAFGTQRAEPSAVRTLRAAGIDPASEQGREILLRNLSGGDLDAQIQNLRAQQQLLDLRQQMSEMQREDRERLTTEALTAQSLRSDLKGINRLRALTDQLEGTLVETGLPLQEARRMLASVQSVTPDNVASALDIDRERARRISAGIQEYEKLSNDLALKRAARLFEGDITDDKLSFVTSTMPNPRMSPGANRRILDSLESEVRSTAEIRNFSLDQESGGSPVGRISPRRIQQMPRAEFESLDLDAITARDQRQAVDQRARELGLIGPNQSLF